MGTIWNKELLNENGQRRYPLALESHGTDTTGTFRLPDDFLVQLDLPYSFALNVDPTKFYIRYLSAYATGFMLGIGYSGTEPVDVATVHIPRHTHTRNKHYPFVGRGVFFDTQGGVNIGQFDSVDAIASLASVEFDLEATRLDVTTIKPYLRTVSDIIVVNGSEESEPITGPIRFESTRNMQITAIQVEGQTTVIQFSAIDGAGTTEDCSCDGDVENLPCIRLINGRGGTNLNIVGDDCIKIGLVQNGIQITDICSRACCGCPELEAITRDMERLNIQRTSLDNYMSVVGQRASSMELIVLGSKIGDRGCDTE